MKNDVSKLVEDRPHLLKAIKGEDDPAIEVFESPAGPVPVWLKNDKKIFIHSKYDPIKEAVRFVSESASGNVDIIIVFGFGFGYHLEALEKLCGTAQRILIIEKNAAIFKMAVERRNLSGILSNRNIEILIDPDEAAISQAIRGIATKTSRLITHRGSHQVHPSYYDNIREIVRSALASKDVNIATLAKFEKTWSANVSRNIGLFVSSPGAGIYYNCFHGVPAIIVSAGPSLPGSLEFIRANLSNSVVIAVDTSYKILERHGIRPHFCISVDPQVLNARYFEGTAETSTVLVADPTVHPSATRYFRGPIAFTGIFFDFLKWIETMTETKGEMAHGGSVSTNAYDFAKRLGCAPIVLTGQDLAFTNGLAHARGSYLDELVYHRISRFFTPEMQNRRQLTALPALRVKGIRSNTVHTNQKMMIFLAWFEKRGDPGLVNASHDGAIIPGIAHVAEDAIHFPCPNYDIQGRINDITQTGSAKNRVNDRKRLAVYVVNEKAQVDGLVPVLAKAIETADELLDALMNKKRDPGRLSSILGSLDEADRLIESKKTAADLISLTVQRVIHTIKEGYELEDAIPGEPTECSVARRSRFLYTGLLDGALTVGKVLDKMHTILSRMQ